ncbi:imm11 family protein, partial [Cronobacter malonaticus]
MNYYFLDFQYPRKGFISGDVTFNPSMDKNYSAIHSELPADLTVEVTLHSSVRVMDVDLFSTTSTALFVSDDLKKTLNDIDVPVQFVPANVHYFDGSEVAKTYWLA